LKNSKPKILMYSHDSYGLGHLRRTLALAEAFVGAETGTSVLILTGSTVSGTFRMSLGIDLVKLPSAVKVASGVYEASRMSIDFQSLKYLRSSLILSAVTSFDPDAFIVDKAPLGMKREVYPALEFLHAERPSTLTVLGLRDVMDDPSRIRLNWREGGISSAIENFYDTILVYGPREVYDPLPEYGLSAATLRRCHYVGYVGRASIPEETSDLMFEPGFHLLKSYLESLRRPAPAFESLVVTGPMMDDASKRKIESLARGLRVRVMEFRADMECLIRDAGAVVSMGGYNTTVELLVAHKPALIVPRVEPRVEQLIRAEQLAELGLVDMIHPHNLTPRLMRTKVEELLERDPASAPRVEVDLSGASRAVDLVTAGIARKHAMDLGA
jgi:predicted glycosyltransferase